MRTHVFGSKHAAVDERLHQAVVARACGNAATAKDVETRVAAMAPGRDVGFKVDEERDDGAVHVLQGALVGPMLDDRAVRRHDHRADRFSAAVGRGSEGAEYE